MARIASPVNQAESSDARNTATGAISPTCPVRPNGGMSRSTLHLHFRALTAMSPLQFQEQLRLHAARQRILTGELDAASAAFEVGYESPSQFNRECKRFFGRPPIRVSRPCETAKSWRSLPLNAELLGCHGAACSRLSQTGLRALALIKSLRTI